MPSLKFGIVFDKYEKTESKLNLHLPFNIKKLKA